MFFFGDKNMWINADSALRAMDTYGVLPETDNPLERVLDMLRQQVRSMQYFD